MRSTWLNDEAMGHILAAMMPANRLALEVADATGLRIDDVLSLKTEQIRRSARPTVVESKTGKRRRVYIPVELRKRMLVQAGRVWVWPGRLKPLEQHRTRQAVNKDMGQAVAVYRRSHVIGPKEHPSPHTARKRAAVRAYHHGGVDAAQMLLNHSSSDLGVTLLYALSDQMQSPKRRGKGSKANGGRKAPTKQA